MADPNRRIHEKDGAFFIQSKVGGKWVDETRTVFGRFVMDESEGGHQEPDYETPRSFPNLRQAETFLQREALRNR